MCSLKNREPKFYAGTWRRCWDIAKAALSDILVPTVSNVSPFCFVMPPQGQGKATFVEVSDHLERNCNKMLCGFPSS